jgi:hypothetical protein
LTAFILEADSSPARHVYSTCSGIVGFHTGSGPCPASTPSQRLSASVHNPLAVVWPACTSVILSSCIMNCHLVSQNTICGSLCLRYQQTAVKPYIKRRLQRRCTEHLIPAEKMLVICERSWLRRVLRAAPAGLCATHFWRCATRCSVVRSLWSNRCWSLDVVAYSAAPRRGPKLHTVG